MTTSSTKLLFWAPRVICIGFTLFLSLFALDVFNEVHGFWRTIAALLIHLVPVYIVLAVLAIAWRWEWIGALGFAGLAVWYACFRGTWHRHPDWVMFISGPLMLLAALFLVNWVKRDQLRARP